MASISFKAVTKSFADPAKKEAPIRVVVARLDLEIADGEFVVLVGPSGCGKSTTLRMIAGLEEPTSGDVFIGERRVNDVPAGDRDVAMVFQSYALYPHLSVFENIAFGLRVRKVPDVEVRKRVQEAADLLGLGELLHRKPGQLSGGQRQRVAMGRAIVRQPKVFLFDEPLSNLDAKLRGEVRAQIARLRRRLNTTIVYVTHDQVEAMTLADRVVVMADGHVQQVGGPMEVYRKPANRFVAGFLGTPTMNFLTARVDDGRMSGKGFSLAHAGPWSGEVTVGMRPQQVMLGGSGLELGEMEVEVVERLGAETYALGNVGGAHFTALCPEGEPKPGERVPVRVSPAGIHVFDSAGKRVSA
ncbi:MAG: sn-glycerol-3-phosphate ABC transporter ATP-binding protein UgpC [Deltaproteobacteria bacterium]|nr:sn-glycerol-3-phosphate ABC transporter ATP-binding protein UgpC [Deltaproteobacteria bacterium]